MRNSVRLGLLASILIAGCVDASDASDSDTLEAAISHAKHARVCNDAGAEVNCHAHVLVDDDAQPLAASGPAGYGPSDLRDAYKITGSGSSGTIIAIVDAYGYPNAEQDLAVYRSTFGLPPCTTANGCFKKVDQNGGTKYPKTDTGWSQEAALDLDMASAMCPNCKLILVEASSASMTNLGQSVNTAVNLGATVVSNSYGGGESS